MQAWSIPRLFGLCVVVTTALAAPCAHAAYADADFGPITWTLTDLAPKDGIEPFFEISNPSNNGLIRRRL